MKHFLIILLLSCSTLLSAQTTAIPDANFEQALINQGYDSGPIDGLVLTANINTIGTLWAGNYGITDLTGIEDFIALQNLWCADNLITNLDVTQNSALGYLNCANNMLASLDVTQNSLITDLRCNNNQLVSLDVSQNLMLKKLYCQDNQLTTINTNQNTLLENLLVSKNPLGSLNLSQNTSLLQLLCDSIGISTLDLSFNTLLTSLSCSKNQLISLDFSQNPLLYGLVCSFNQIISLNFSPQSGLASLTCSNNQLTCLNVKNGNNDSLFYFKAENNPNLTCIEVDNVTFSVSNWTDTISYIFDPASSFSTNCPSQCSVGIEELPTTSISIYPNPTTGQ
ncbi:MAG: hypothetical protein COA97_06195, partial [Flavobacteriales bacterium]